MKLSMFRGDSAIFEMACKQSDGSPLDLTSGSLFFTGKHSSRQLDADAVFQKDTNNNGILISDGPGGIAHVTLAPSDTADIYAPSILSWDLQYVTSGGMVFTLLAGTLLVKADVTRAISTP